MKRGRKVKMFFAGMMLALGMSFGTPVTGQTSSNAPMPAACCCCCGGGGCKLHQQSADDRRKKGGKHKKGGQSAQSDAS